jgi:hypothetical protein
MKGPTPRHLWIYVTRCLGLRSYFRSPGDGRPQPQIPAKALLWSMLIGQVLRTSAFLAVERLVRSSARRALAVSKSFSDDTLGYFTERLDPRFTRTALAQVLRRAKRNKASKPAGASVWRWMEPPSDGARTRVVRSVAPTGMRARKSPAISTMWSWPVWWGPGYRYLMMSSLMDPGIANTPPDSVCCVEPSNCWALASLLMSSWTGNSPRLLFSIPPAV